MTTDRSASLPSLLADAHDALHAVLDERLVDVLVALVERDVARARAILALFVEELVAHARVEEEQVLPLLLPLTPTEGPRSAVHIVPEHKLLCRLADELDARLSALPEPATSRDVVDVLPLALRFRGAYEHHTEREHRLYPLLQEATLGVDVAAALRRALQEAARS